MAQGDHAHDHPHINTSEHGLTYYEKRIIALSNLLIDKGLISSQDLLDVLKEMDDTTSMVGARVVARAWGDPAFKQRLLQDANLVMSELGINLQRFRLLKVLENTAAVHNAIVCTLCSCYPIPLLGHPTGWYNDGSYRSWMVEDPRACLADMGLHIPDAQDIRVWDSTAEVRYLVLPQRPAGTDGMTQEQLAQLVTRDSMIGVGLPLTPNQMPTPSDP